jgi:hypothetical protein
LKHFLHLFGLAGFAFAQVLLDLLARHPEFLIAHRAGPVDVALLVALLIVPVPAFAWLSVQAAERFNPRFARLFYLTLIALLAALAALPPLKSILSLPPGTLVALAGALGVGTAIAYARLIVVQRLATVLAAAPLVFALVFAGRGSIRKLVSEPAASASAGIAIDATAPVVLVIFDELPTTSLLDERGEIDAVRYPAFAELARKATFYRNASTVHAATSHAVPAILTGRLPDPTKLPILADHSQNLFTLLAGSYDVNAFETLTILSERPADERSLAGATSLVRDLVYLYLHALLPGAWTLSLPAVTETWRDFAEDPGGAVGGRDAIKTRQDVWAELARTRSHETSPGLPGWRRAQFAEFVASIGPRDRPSVHFLHILLPHIPYRYLPSGRIYFEQSQFGSRTNAWEDEWWVIQHYQQHLLQVGFADTLLGTLLARLREVGLYDRALIVVTSDHGVSFWPGESHRFPWRSSHAEDVLSIPLLIKSPHQREGNVSLRNVETIDILPTITHELGFRPPLPIDGCAIPDPACAERDQKRLFHKAGLRTFARDLPLRRESLERKLEIFGSGNQRGLIAIGPYSALVGRRVADLPVRAAEGTRAVLMRVPFALAASSPTSSAPARILGKLDGLGTNAERAYVAIAVRGVIGAVVGVQPESREGRTFSAMLSEDALPSREGEVTVLGVKGSPEEPTLIRYLTTVADFH